MGRNHKNPLLPKAKDEAESWQFMTEVEKRNWLDNILQSAYIVSSAIGEETVRQILQKYGADSVEELNPSQYPYVFSELYAVEVDIKD